MKLLILSILLIAGLNAQTVEENQNENEQRFFSLIKPALQLAGKLGKKKK